MMKMYMSKVVDYKTGHSDFDLLKTYYGLKIQLFTYMREAISFEKKRHKGKEYSSGRTALL